MTMKHACVGFRSRSCSSRSGFTLLEVLVAVAILAVVSSTLLVIRNNSVAQSNEAFNLRIAAQLAADKMRRLEQASLLTTELGAGRFEGRNGFEWEARLNELTLSKEIHLYDEVTIKQVLLILLDNASRHADGLITVSSGVMESRVTVSVGDSGPGIEPEMLPHLFERFSQGRVSGDDHGTGLGLAIAKALVEAQGGTLTIESQLGEGSVFSVTLPRATDLSKARSTYM